MSDMVDRLRALPTSNNKLRDQAANRIESDKATIERLERIETAAEKCKHGCRRCNSIDDRYKNLNEALAADTEDNNAD